MRTIKHFVCFFLPVIFSVAHAQQFVNGDLEGTFSTIDELPDGWQNVPYTDPACKANGSSWATPDLTGRSGPDRGFGIAGIPYSGSSFVTGLHFKSGSSYFHEGIMQEVDDLIPGVSYEISFYQSVVKQENARDTSGSWEVFVDSTLAGVSAPSSSLLEYNDINLKWEKRTVVFIATKTHHAVKFLPLDDDTDISVTPDKGGLRMGIDLITLNKQATYQIELNPSSVRGIVSVLNDEKTKMSLQVLDDNGKIVAAKDPVEQGSNEIDLRGQPDGEYTFKFAIGEETYTMRYAKN